MKTIGKVVVTAGLLVAALSAQAGVIDSQGDLTSLLGSSKKVETFEGNGSVPSGQQYTSAFSIDSANSNWITQSGVTYSSDSLWLNDNGYYDLNTRTLGDSAAGRPISIAFTQPINAFGLDLQGYQGYSQEGTISVYDLNNSLLTSSNVNGGFFGWQNSAGIGRVTVASQNGYIMIDNLGFGTAAAVPEPASLCLLGLGLAGLVAARRKKA